MSKIRILHIISSMGRGGKERQLYEFLKGLKDQAKVSLVVLSRDFAYPVSELGIPVFSFNENQRKRIQTYWAVCKLIRNLSPDVIHFWDALSATHALIAKMVSKCKVVDGSIRYAGKIDAPLPVRLLKRMRFGLADRIIANSEAGLQVEGLLSKKKAIVIHNGMDLFRFSESRQIEPDLPCLNDNRIKVVMVAGFRPAKDHQTLIKAAEILSRKYENLLFVLVGGGEGRATFEKLVPDKIRDRVLFMGNSYKVEQILQSCDIGILLNNTHGHAEGMSNAIMEYMAARLPVIATNSGGNPELVLDGVTGFLLESFNVDHVVQSLVELIESPELRKKLGEAGRLRIEENFSLERMAASYLSVYQELVQG